MKNCLIKLKRTLLYRKLLNHYFLLTLSIILFILLLINFNIWYLLSFIIVIIIGILYEVRFIFIFICLFIACFLNIIIKDINYKSISFGKIYIQAEVIKINRLSNNYKITIKDSLVKYIFYIDELNLCVGDEIVLYGQLVEADINHTDYLFNYNRYLRNNNIKGIIKDCSYDIVDHSYNFYSIHYLLQNYYKTHFEGQTRGYLEALVIGCKDNLSDDIYENIQSIGISHLFVISGLHMNIIMLIVTLLLKVLHIPSKFNFVVITTLFIFYYVVTGGLVSILRVLLVYVLTNANNKYNLKLTTFDIYMIIILMLLIVNPYYIFDYSFILTFLISSSLVNISSLVKQKGIKGFIVNNLIISLNSILVTIPIIININPNVNLLSLLYNIIYIPVVSYLILPLSLITTFISFLKYVYEFIINIFTVSTSYLSNIKFLRISFGDCSAIIYILYYVFYVFIIHIFKSKKYKKFIFFLPITVIIFFIMTNVRLFDFYQRIIFLDLPQGEATLILDRANATNILIDTGEDLGDDLIIYLRKLGIRRLDYVFISHGDSDHNGKLKDLIKEFTIKNIVVNIYDIDSINICLENNFKGNIIKVQRGNYIRYKSFEFNILLPNTNALDKNNNSMVMIANVFNTKILFLGDIEKEKEEELIKFEKHFSVDIIKVPHHGSKTSSSNILLSNVDYKFAICMSGYKNTFGFPVSSIIDRYNNRCLTTSRYYTITLYKRKSESSMSIKYTNYKI